MRLAPSETVRRRRLSWTKEKGVSVFLFSMPESVHRFDGLFSLDVLTPVLLGQHAVFFLSVRAIGANVSPFFFRRQVH